MNKKKFQMKNVNLLLVLKNEEDKLYIYGTSG